MALTNCPECGREVSSAATTCPHCGHPLAIEVPPPPPGGGLNNDKRREILNQAISNRLARPGAWRVESRTDFDAIIVGGKQVNHTLHLLLSVFTLGIWLIVWALVAMTAGETRYRMAVDEHGNGSFMRLG